MDPFKTSYRHKAYKGESCLYPVCENRVDPK